MLPAGFGSKVEEDRPNHASYQLLPTSPSVPPPKASPPAAATVVRANTMAPEPEPKSCPVQFFEKWQNGRFTIMPEDNPIMDVWDLVVITALFATAVVLPFEVALLDSSDTPDAIYFIGKSIDYIFTVDIMITFNVAFTVTDQTQTQIDMYEKRPFKIAAHYMAVPFSQNFSAGWFWPDVLTVIPWESLPMVKDAQSLRLIRVLRLVRMLRLVRVIKLFKRCQTHSGVSFSFVKILTCASTTLLLVHWLACFWAHLGLHPLEEDGKTWLSNHLMQGKDIAERPKLEIYNHALYFCTVVLTTVGFGDIVPTNNVEVVIMILTIFLTGITWAWVVANVVNVITNMDVFGTHFNQIMDDINALMATTGCTSHLKIRIRRHIHESYNVQRRRHNHDAIKWLSAGLQGELAVQSGVDKAMHCIWYFRDLPNSVIIELADEFKGDLFSPNEIIMDRHSVSVIIRGSCIKRGKLFSRDAVIGEDVILASDWLRDTSCPRTLTYLEVMSIHRENMREAAAKYPDFDRRLRKAQLKLALWRCFVKTAWEVKRLQELKTEGKMKVDGRGGRKSTKESAWDIYFQTGGSARRKKDTKEDGKVINGLGWAESMERTSATEKNDVVMKEAAVMREAQLNNNRRLTELQTSLDTRSEQLETRVSTMEGQLEMLAGGMKEVMAELEKTRLTLERTSPEAKTPTSVKRGFFRTATTSISTSGSSS